MFALKRLNVSKNKIPRIFSILKKELAPLAVSRVGTYCTNNINARTFKQHGTQHQGSQHRLLHSMEVKEDVLGVVDVHRNDGKRWVDVTWNDDSVTSYPYVWLRDNCQCLKCFHPTTKSRLVLMSNLDTKIEPKDVEVSEDGGLEITWPDGHRSIYDTKWLLQRAFTDEAKEKRRAMYGVEHQFWNAELQDNIPTYDFKKIIDDDNYFLNWLTGLQRYGLTLIKDTPQDYGHLQKIADRVCYSRRTNYGDVFRVKSKVNPSNLAYTSVTLGLHCDLADCSYVPGVQFLHCVNNTSVGGSSQFADASYAAKIIEENYPEANELLSTKILDFYDKGSDVYRFHNIARWTTFVRDIEGKVKGVCFNNQSRDSYLNLPIEDVQPLYDALKLLENIMYDPQNIVNHTLKPGEIVVFDNLRVLHGRQQYDVGSSGVRNLEGIFIDWDEICSRIRVLKEDLGLL
ncbi:gamma-butyrobetaine dioxygenase-like [Tubulanus polymorphus]|uniref:gamma-butyrobetaine dioxygenase-like n=1 Tax=Tubulanus polymorphus TaxID=672921 RepID=UPI003DA420AD